MKKIVLFAAASGLAIAAVPAAAAPGDTSTASGVATATVVSPITLTHTPGAALNFGTLTSGTAGGTVVVTAAGAGSSTGEVTLVSGSTATADAFTVTGDAARSFSIATTAGSVSAGANSMAFTTAASAATGVLGAGGSASFTVGGTLTVAGNQAPGAYTGTYSATVAYN